MPFSDENHFLMNSESPRVQQVLMAHRELCTRTAFESMFRSTVRRKSIVNWLMKVVGLYDRGRLNYLSLETVRNKICINTLPDELTGLRILQLSGLHLCEDDELLANLKKAIEVIDYDICILTGGIGCGTRNDYLLAEQARHMFGANNSNVFAVLGVGDTSSTVEALEQIGITVLNNEFASLSILGRRIEIFGAECRNALIDPQFENLIRSFNAADLRLFLSANPQFRSQANGLEFDLMLTGAQSCRHCAYRTACRWNQMAKQLPTVKHSWSIHGLEGYTSNGLGRQSLDVRIRTRPELVIHELVNNQYI